MNKLFNTQFEVLNTEERVGQTTKGIWTAFNSEYKICILDCEGTDSKERGEDQQRHPSPDGKRGCQVAELEAGRGYGRGSGV